MVGLGSIRSLDRPAQIVMRLSIVATQIERATLRRHQTSVDDDHFALFIGTETVA